VGKETQLTLWKVTPSDVWHQLSWNKWRSVVTQNTKRSHHSLIYNTQWSTASLIYRTLFLTSLVIGNKGKKRYKNYKKNIYWFPTGWPGTLGCRKVVPGCRQLLAWRKYQVMVELSCRLGVNFNHIFCANFMYESALRSFSLVTFWLYNEFDTRVPQVR